ncbi:MAG: hypothetical protein A2Z16_02035 [Chloroflexi bacterium RBG_16_54_18]|nr:MAG: hypothetical protein A2Z16_02035 [Chloroflexi bacterium RBG_16_54_18]
MNTIQILLQVYLVVFYGVAIFWRSYRVWKVTGVYPYRLSAREYQRDDVHELVSRLFRLTLAGVAFVVLVYSFALLVYVYFAPFTWLQTPFASVAGLYLLAVALIWVLVAQRHMGDSWRIGIDTEHISPLITHGVFEWSRNPIFLGMRVLLIGLFLVIPTALTLALWWLGDVLMQVQVYLEEEHLARQHGTAYEAYRQRVRRWI